MKTFSLLLGWAIVLVVFCVPLYYMFIQPTFVWFDYFILKNKRNYTDGDICQALSAVVSLATLIGTGLIIYGIM